MPGLRPRARGLGYSDYTIDEHACLLPRQMHLAHSPARAGARVHRSYESMLLNPQSGSD